MPRRKRVYHGEKRDKVVRSGTLSAVGAQTVTLDLNRGNVFRLKTGGQAAALAASIALANDLKAKYNIHLADVGAHDTAADTVNVIAAADASNLATLIALVTELLVDYDAHDADSNAGTNSYHSGTGAAYDLAATTAPTTLTEAIVDLNDFRQEFLQHIDDDTGHGTLESDSELDVAAVAGDYKTTLTLDILNAWSGASLKVFIESIDDGDSLAVLKINGSAATLDMIEALSPSGTSYESTVYNHYDIVVFDTNENDSVVSASKGLVAGI